MENVRIFSPLGIFYAHFVYLIALWYILWPFGIGIFLVLVYCAKKQNLAALHRSAAVNGLK
jgi:hypothetical protein